MTNTKLALTVVIIGFGLALIVQNQQIKNLSLVAASIDRSTVVLFRRLRKLECEVHTPDDKPVECGQ